MAAKAEIIHADSTHKVTTEKLPLPVIGTSDGNRKIHLLGILVASNEVAESYRLAFEALKDATEEIVGEPMKPKYLVADGDYAIHNGWRKVYGDETKIVMCYAHVIMNIDLKYKFKNAANKSLIKDDLRTLYLSSTEEIFDKGCKLFEAKWKSKEPELVERLKKSFFSKLKNWYIGFCKRVPNTNNFIERFNGTMKTYQLFHQKQPLKTFIHTALTIVEKRSRQYIMDKEKFEAELTIPEELLHIGCQFNAKFVEIVNDDGSVDFYMFASDIERDISLDEVKKIENAKHKSFDEFAAQAVNTLSKVSFPANIEDWNESICSCPAFSKNYMCKHVISVAHQLGLLDAPVTDYHKKPLFGKSTRGKPKKASKKPLQYDD